MKAVKTKKVFQVLSLFFLLSWPPFPTHAHREPPTAEEEPQQPFPPIVQVKVLEVIDGSTIEVEYEGQREKVRYIGISTTETGRRKGGEDDDREAKEANRKLVEGQTVWLEFDVKQRDHDGRLLAYVYLLDGTFVNAWLVEHGYMQVVTMPPNVTYQNLFLKLQRKAQEARRGLWGKGPRGK